MKLKVLPLEETNRIPTLEKTLKYLPLLFQISSITHVTLSGCTCRDIIQLFGYALMLKYLNVRDISSSHSWMKYYQYQSFNNDRAIHLKQLIIGEFGYKFEEFKMFVKR